MNTPRYDPAEAHALRLEYLTGQVIESLEERTVVMRRTASPPERVDLYVYQPRRGGPDDDRVEQQWVLTFADDADLPRDTYAFYARDWQPGDRAVSLFQAYCDPSSTPYTHLLDTMGHVATFTFDDGYYLESLFDPVNPDSDGAHPNRLKPTNTQSADQPTGVDGILRTFDATETAAMRSELIDVECANHVAAVFEAHPILQSALLLVAQYWNDNANDEVLLDWRFSMHETPSMEPATWFNWYSSAEGRTDPDLPSHLNQFKFETDFLLFPGWDKTVPALAAFCLEGGDQNYPEQSFAPLAIYRKSPTGVAVEMVGEMHRPWLDGVAFGDGNDRIFPDVPSSYSARIASQL